MELLTVEQVAKLMAVHPQTVRRLAHRRKIKYYRVGNRLRFKREDVEAYLETIGVKALD